MTKRFPFRYFKASPEIMAVELNQVAAHTKASNASAMRYGGGPSSIVGLGAVIVFCVAGQAGISGRAKTRCISAQPRHASRQPHVASTSPKSGQPTVLAEDCQQKS